MRSTTRPGSGCRRRRAVCRPSYPAGSPRSIAATAAGGRTCPLRRSACSARMASGTPIRSARMRADNDSERGPMRVLGIVWTGVQTTNFDDMAVFLERLFGTEAPRQEPGFRLWSLPDGDIVELYAGGTKPPFENAPVVGFRVDDLDAGRELLEGLGAEILGGYGPN